MIIVAVCNNVNPAISGPQPAGNAWTVPDVQTALRQLGLTPSTAQQLGALAAGNAFPGETPATQQAAQAELAYLDGVMASINAAVAEASAIGAQGNVMITQMPDGSIVAGGR